MAYSRSKKLTDTERKLQILRTQLYGKEPSAVKPTNSTFSFKSETEPTQSSEPKPKAEMNFLKHDLIKICLLATSAVGTELLIFIGISKA